MWPWSQSMGRVADVSLELFTPLVMTNSLRTGKIHHFSTGKLTHFYINGHVQKQTVELPECIIMSPQGSTVTSKSKIE